MFRGLLSTIPKQYMIIFFSIVFVINVFAFILMGIDKRNSKRHKRRIPEAVLLAFAVFGGGFGILLGMIAFHHKTNAARHTAFVNGVPIILLVELLIGLFFVASTI